jgi:hypothetical protein
MILADDDDDNCVLQWRRCRRPSLYCYPVGRVGKEKHGPESGTLVKCIVIWKGTGLGHHVDWRALPSKTFP